MNGSRPRRILRGAGSLAVTLVLLFGVPLLLAAWVDWPLPSSIPSIDSLEQAVQSGISDQVVIKTLAVIGWIAWAQLALGIIAETVAVTRGRQAIHLPMLPGFQITSARLVAGILMIASTIQPGRAQAAPTPIPVVAEVISATAAPPVAVPEGGSNGSAPTSIASTATPVTPTAPVEHPTVTVQRHDSYWEIAERTLGDGFRWQEILDLNVGRILPDGTIIAAGDDTLYTGWVLLLPTDATGDPPTTDAPSESATELAGDQDLSTVVVERGDNLWSISEGRLEVDLGREPADPEVAPYWREVIDANQDRYVQPGDPNLIYPGQVLVLPQTGNESPELAPVETEPAPASDEATEPTEAAPLPPASEQADQPPVAPPSTTTTPAEPEPPPALAEEPASTSSGAVDDVADDNSEAEASNGLATPLAVVVGGLSSIALAVGLKRLLDSRRRRFANEHDGQLPGRTPIDQHELHQAVVAQADEERIDDLQGVLGRLAVSLAAMPSTRRPRMIRHSADSLEVLLDQRDTNAPAGWTSTDDGTVWTLAEPPDLDDPHDEPISPAPLMVTIGQPEDDAQLYLDLETDGLISLTGDPDVATNLARSIVTELTLSPLAEALRVIAVGDLVGPDAEVLEHLTVVDSWDDVTEDLHAWATQSHDALTENEWPNAFIARGHQPDHDALVPVAVVADRPPPKELADSLRANLPSTAAVVVVGEFDGAVATVHCETDALNFDMIDLACSPQEVRSDELAEMSRLLIATDSPEEQQLMEKLRAEYETDASSEEPGSEAGIELSVGSDAPGPEPDEPPGYDVLVRLLGDITVEGAKPLKPKATAVVTYLALHRSVTTARLEEACWFGSDGTSHRKRLRDVMTEIRGALGSQHFPANRTGAYAAGPQVRTDLDLFDWHIHRAADREADGAVNHYQAALDLVIGRPFAYPNAARASFGWVDFEHHATNCEHRVASVAQACSEMYIDADEPGEAITMLSGVVRAIPLNSIVVEALMRAHVANNDRSGAESVYKEHAASLEQARLGDPDDAIEQLRLDLQSTES